MISREGVVELFEGQLKTKLEGLEEERKKVARLTVLSVSFILGTLLTFMAVSNGQGAAAFLLPVGAVILGFAIYFSSKWYKRQKAYRARFKNDIVGVLIHAFNAEWKFYPDMYITEQEFSASDLFTSNYNRYKGDDLIVGRIDQTEFRCSELKVERHEKSGKSSRTVKIFKGLLFHADFNKEFNGRTYVRKDISESLFGKVGRSLQRLTTKASLVTLENPEFEKRFVVHSTDQVEARYILTPAIMEAIIELQESISREIALSFIGNRVYCAIHISENLFEPKVFRSGVNLGDILNFHHVLQMNEKIIHQLNLNTRIWTKD